MAVSPCLIKDERNSSCSPLWKQFPKKSVKKLIIYWKSNLSVHSYCPLFSYINPRLLDRHRVSRGIMCELEVSVLSTFRKNDRKKNSTHNQVVSFPWRWLSAVKRTLIELFRSSITAPPQGRVPRQAWCLRLHLRYTHAQNKQTKKKKKDTNTPLENYLIGMLSHWITAEEKKKTKEHRGGDGEWCWTTATVYSTAWKVDPATYHQK